jgi:hypothetical protein
VLVPIEHLAPAGMRPAFADFLRARAGWSAAQAALFDRGFRAYWERGAALAARTRTWPPPRLRHVAVVAGEPLAVRPYVQLLNTSAWMLYAADLDPATSHSELLAYLLAVGDRLAISGQVGAAAVQTALWWLERSDEECAAFASAAQRSTRPDADALRAVAAALGWLRRLHHDPLRRPAVVAQYRRVPGTGLLVSPGLMEEPPALAERCDTVAAGVLAAYRTRQHQPGGARAGELCTWLASAAPPFLVMAGTHVLWDPERPERVGALRRALEGAPAPAVGDVRADLEVIERVTRAFHAAVRDPEALPVQPPENTTQSGYTYLHRERRLIAYDLDEPGIERLAGPALPYARLMLAARTAHEWAHLADAAGWVPRAVDADEWRARRDALAALLDGVVGDAPASVRAATAADEALLRRERPLGAALVRILASRLPDYRANLVARHLLRPPERETYVRQNVRTLRHEYPPGERWRLLVRYLFEYQYLQPALGMTAIAEPLPFFTDSTWFAEDFFATGILDEARFTALADAVGRLCTGYAIDPRRLSFT